MVDNAELSVTTSPDIPVMDFVSTDPRFFRAEELKYLRGDCSKIKNVLGWEPEYTFETMMDEMVEHWMERYIGK